MHVLPRPTLFALDFNFCIEFSIEKSDRVRKGFVNAACSSLSPSVGVDVLPPEEILDPFLGRHLVSSCRLHFPIVIVELCCGLDYKSTRRNKSV